jgi:hypothetical protein
LKRNLSSGSDGAEAGLSRSQENRDSEQNPDRFAGWECGSGLAKTRAALVVRDTAEYKDCVFHADIPSSIPLRDASMLCHSVSSF